jgi:hypothetical protein
MCGHPGQPTLPIPVRHILRWRVLAWAGGRQHVQSGPSLAAPVFRLLRVAWPLTTDVVRGTRHVRGMYAATRYAACTRHVRGTLSGR